MTAAIQIAWAFLRGLPWQLWAALALAGGLWLAYSTVEGMGYDRGRAEGDAALSAYRQQVEGDRAQSEWEARQREATHRAELAAIADRYEQEQADAQASADAVAADLRAGNLRLRDHWQGCESAKARVPATAGGASEPDGGAGLREQGAGDLVSVGAECDAIVRGLQRVIRSR